jgi:predicted RNA polymerase sigma factor
MARTRDGRDPPGDDRALTDARDTLAAVFREEAGRLAASVTRILGDFDVAEEVVQDALLAACQQWPVEGIPDRPGAWLWTVARRRAIDVLRRDVRYRERAAAVQLPVGQAEEDDRLMLVFTCCHPALSQEAQVALTLRTVDALAGDLDRYHLYHATRAELLRDVGRRAEARLADELALRLTGNPAERALLEQRLT